MTTFDNDYEQDNLFGVSAYESRSAMAKFVNWFGWLALFALIIVTAVHAISLVIDQIGLATGIMGLIRVSGVVLVEAIALIVAAGFAAHAWRAGQKVVGLGVEVVWLIFAALNLVTSFTVEANALVYQYELERYEAQVAEVDTATAVALPPAPVEAPLPDALYYWLHYGLPLSALIVGALFYTMIRLDPDHRRAAEMQAVSETDRMQEFAAVRDVRLSSQMQQVRRQRGWLAVVESLRKQNYTDDQIAFMTRHIPGLVPNGEQIALPAPSLDERRARIDDDETNDAPHYNIVTGANTRYATAAQTHPAPAHLEPDEGEGVNFTNGNGRQ